jgi:molecular chaperone DnaJ
MLGVGKDASKEEIQRAYRKMALKYHPDKNPDDSKATENFKKVAEAFEILSDPEKRRVYDQRGMAGVHDTGFRGFESAEDVYSHFGDIFGDRFGTRFHQRRSEPQPGRNLRFILPVPFDEAALGAEREIEVPVAEVCSTCHGTGAASGKPSEPCPGCNGTGNVTRQGQRQGGFFSVSSPCDACGGTGRRREPPCSHCSGEGRVAGRSCIKVKIPSGIDTGRVLRLAGQGEAGRNGGPKGDLLIEVEVQPHPTFQRQGRNIRSDVKVPVATALLGGKAEIPTLKGSVMLTVPPGTSSDQVFRIRDQGIPANDGSGDHLVRVVITVPKELSPDAEKAVREHFL